MKTITNVRVDLAARSYDIRIGAGWIGELGHAVTGVIAPGRCCVVTNPEIEKRWGAKVAEPLRAAGFEVETLSIPDGEQAKAIETVSLIHDFTLERRFERGSSIVALGGGVVGDVAGFAAATLLRGVALVQLPTSLLAMVDSSVGGKTGVNHTAGKNLVGAFYQPRFVGIDLDFLTTLPEVEYRAGLAEVVKYGVISDPEFFDFVESNIGAIEAKDPETLGRLIARSCEIKAEVVSADETEQGVRAILNFGHTYAHAIENLLGYGKVKHGEAVAMGMVAACRLGEIVGGFDAESTERLARVLESLGLPARLPEIDAGEMMEAMYSDKKVRAGQLRFVLPEAMGRVRVAGDIAESAVLESIGRARRRSGGERKSRALR